MIAVFIATAAVAVERFVNRRRLKVHEVVADVGWLTLVFAGIEFAYLFVVEAATLNYGSVARPLWYTEWGVFKDLLLEASVGVLLILTSVFLESTGIELKRPEAKETQKEKKVPSKLQKSDKCNIEWHETT